MDVRKGEKMNARQLEKIVGELANVVAEGIHIVSADGKSIFYNHAMENLEKTKREDVIGKPFREVFSHIPIEESTLQRALIHNEATRNQVQTYLNQNGKEVTTVNSTIPVIDYEGNTIAAIEVAKDITDIKKMSNTILELQNETISKGEASGRPIAEPTIKRYTFENLIGESKPFKAMIERAKRASKSGASVFIYGETGTGKELVAQSIHFDSIRKSKPFLAQNCAALPESLLEGILFGTAKGGFTGAVDRAGLFEQASGGTLLLDEVSAMPYDLQSKLLRVLQEEYIRRVGGTKDIPIDVKIIATVNESPQELIESGKLRKDLYYRLNIVNISIPSLRERKDDIPLLVDSFIRKHNERFEREIWMVSENAMTKLMEYDFPGNIRELENLVMSAVSLADNEHVLTEKLLQIPTNKEEIKNLNLGYSLGKIGLEEYLSTLETNIIKEALADNHGNISKAADQLGIKRQTLQHKLKKIGR